jgi:pentatricopeptide repeat protein
VASRTCRSRIKYLLKSGNSEVAVRTLADMNRSGIPINISHYNLLVDYFGRRGELDRMSRVLSAMPRDMAWNVATITSLMTSYAAHGNWRRAKKVFKLHCTNMRESQGVSSPWKIIKPDVVLFDAMIHIAAQSGNSQCVAEWYQLMQEFGFSPSHKTLYNRILGYLGLGTRPFSGVPDSRELSTFCSTPTLLHFLKHLSQCCSRDDCS